VLWQSRLRQRDLPDSDNHYDGDSHHHYDGDSHHHYDGDSHYYYDGDSHYHYDGDSHYHYDGDSHYHYDAYVPTEWQLLHRRHWVLRGVPEWNMLHLGGRLLHRQHWVLHLLRCRRATLRERKMLQDERDLPQRQWLLCRFHLRQQWVRQLIASHKASPAAAAVTVL
jgi:hypothetical protein